MLFNVLLVCLVAYVCATPFFYVYVLKLGMRIAERPEQVAEERTFNVKTKKPMPKMSPDEERRVQILSNIDKYDGTSNGQVKIKR